MWHTRIIFVWLLPLCISARELEFELLGHGGPLFLTPLIARGQVEEARRLSVVNATLFAGVQSHSGYITVNETAGWHLFFWFFPAPNKPLESTPWVIWLQGGPGLSSMYGIFQEIGPIRINPKSGKVQKMPITWGSNYHLLFIDNPVGTGFSFTETDTYANNEETIGECLLNFVQQFLQVFPGLRKAPLFLAGESYAGKFIPAFGHFIHTYKNESRPINLKGLAIGNGWIDPPSLLHYSDFELWIGLISPEKAKSLGRLEKTARKLWKMNRLEDYKQAAATAILAAWHVPVNIYNYQKDLGSDPYSQEQPFIRYLNRSDVQDALHVKPMAYQRSNDIVYRNLIGDFFLSAKPWLEELLEHYGVFCYNGEFDLDVAYSLSVHTYRSLKWSGAQEYKNAPRIVVYNPDNGKVIGFERSGGNFSEMMVRGAGHEVTADNPRAAKQIIDTFIEQFT